MRLTASNHVADGSTSLNCCTVNACTTVKTCPATLMCAVRSAPLEFAVTLQLIEAEPVPDEELMESQEPSEAAIHGQPAPVVTLTVPSAAVESSARLVAPPDPDSDRPDQHVEAMNVAVTAALAFMVRQFEASSAAPDQDQN